MFRDPASDAYELISMWVRPQARGRRIAEPLVRAVIDHVIAVGGDCVHLWVNESNRSARRLYERCGFGYTGERQPLPSNPALTELGMRWDSACRDRSDATQPLRFTPWVL